MQKIVRENIGMVKIRHKAVILTLLFICCFGLFGTASVSAKTSVATMDKTHVYQWDAKYKSVKCYRNTSNVYNSGCGLVSINHACNFVKGTNKSINTMIKEIDGKNGIKDAYYGRYTNNKGVVYSAAAWKTPKMIAEYYGLVATRHDVPNDVNTIEQALKDGHCVWTNGKGSVFVGPNGELRKRGGHCVMFYRYADGKFYCHDSCEKTYTTYTREQMKTIYNSSLSLCGTWIISKNNLSPNKVSTFSLTPGNGQFDIYAKKPGTVSGYQVRYRVDGTSAWTTKTFKGTGNLNANIRDLKASTKYQVQVRTFLYRGKGAYCSNWTNYKIVQTTNAPCGTKVYTLKKAGTNGFTVTAKKTPSITGYQVAYRVKDTSSWVTKSYKTTGDLNKTISGLKAKTYHVKVRTYRSVSGKIYYSGWSGWKAVTI